MSYSDTLRLARRVKDFWAALGYDVRVSVVQARNAGGNPEGASWAIKSDLMNGLPAKARPGIADAILNQVFRGRK